MIEVRPLDLSSAGLKAAAAMLREAMPSGGHINADLLNWQYNLNPVGAAVGLEAWDNGRLVSHCATQPLVARLYGRQVRGLMSLNAATVAGHLGRGIYFGMARDLYADARNQGYEFGVAVTNNNSTPGFIRECGFELVRPLEARLGLASPRVLHPRVETDFEKLWNNDTLKWRLSPPHTRYRFVPAAAGTLAVLAATKKAGIEAILGHVSADLKPKRDREPRRPLQPLRLWLGVDERIDWRRSLYRNLPLRLRPSPLNLIFADLTASGIGVDPQRVRWSGLDFDDF